MKAAVLLALLGLCTPAYALTTVSQTTNGGTVQTTDKILVSRPVGGGQYQSAYVTIGTLAMQGSVLPSQMPLFSSTANGAVPSSGGGTTNFLRADGAWVAVQQPTLTNGTFWIGNASNIPTGVQMSGDCTITNTGGITCLKSNGSIFGSLAFLNAVNNSNWSGASLASSNGGTGAANTGVFSFGGNVSFVGANPITLTGVGTTSLTLPTSGTVTALGNTATGSGSIVLSNSPTLITPNIGAATGSLSGNALTATALASVPTQCTGSQFATGIAANGNANCGTPPASVGTSSSGQILINSSNSVAGLTIGTGLVNSSGVLYPALPVNNVYVGNSSGIATATPTVSFSGDMTVNTSGVVTVTGLNGVAVTNQGTGGKVQLATGTTTTGNFLAYDANGNAVDSGKNGSTALGTSAAAPAPNGVSNQSDGLFETASIPVGVSCGGTQCAQFTSGGLAINTTTAATGINLTGQSAQAVQMVRNTTASTSGTNLSLQAGGATSGGSNLQGGNLNLIGGIATGNGASQIRMFIYGGGSSGTADASQITGIVLKNNGTAPQVGIGTTNPTAMLTLASNLTPAINLTRSTSGGVNLPITAGGALSGGTNALGGNLVLSSGVSTGSGTSSIVFQTFPGLAASTTDNTAVTALTITGGGALQLSGQIPSVSSCGGGTITTGSTTNKGSIMGISAATACTITFASNAALSAAPACTFSTSTGIAVGISAISTTAVTASFASFSGSLYYLCD